MVLIFAYTFLFVAGYVASSYTWPWLRTKLGGVELEIKDLEARILSLRITTKAPAATPPVPPAA